jgi:hypothetical protein
VAGQKLARGCAKEAVGDNGFGGGFLKHQFHSWRPISGGAVALTDLQLSKIGLIAVYEASAKAAVALSLRPLENLSHAEWVELDRQQFSQLMKRLKTASDKVDEELSRRVCDLENALKTGQDMRHAILHATWGQAGNEEIAFAYDRRRRLELNAKYIDTALERCADLKRAGHWMALRVAELIENGVINERPAGPGVSILTSTRLVRL